MQTASEEFLLVNPLRDLETELCEAIASMTKRLCTEYVDPRGLEAILANRLIPLDKGEGAVRPIGLGEVLRRIMGKCVTKVTKPEVIDASGSLQVCAGHKSGSEAAIHAMRELFEHDNSDAVTYIHTYFIGSSPRGFSESILHYKIINQVHDNKNITMIKEDKGQ